MLNEDIACSSSDCDPKIYSYWYIADMQKYLFMWYIIEKISRFLVISLIYEYICVYTTQVEVSSVLQKLFNVSLAFHLNLNVFKLFFHMESFRSLTAVAIPHTADISSIPAPT